MNVSRNWEDCGFTLHHKWQLCALEEKLLFAVNRKREGEKDEYFDRKRHSLGKEI